MSRRRTEPHRLSPPPRPCRSQPIQPEYPREKGIIFKNRRQIRPHPIAGVSFWAQGEWYRQTLMTYLLGCSAESDDRVDSGVGFDSKRWLSPSKSVIRCGCSTDGSLMIQSAWEEERKGVISESVHTRSRQENGQMRSQTRCDSTRTPWKPVKRSMRALFSRKEQGRTQEGCWLLERGLDGRLLSQRIGDVGDGIPLQVFPLKKPPSVRVVQHLERIVFDAVCKR